jgi:hypothetical protein
MPRAEHYSRFHRLRLVDHTRRLNRSDIDAGIVGYVQCSPANCAAMQARYGLAPRIAESNIFEWVGRHCTALVTGRPRLQQQPRFPAGGARSAGAPAARKLLAMPAADWGVFTVAFVFVVAVGASRYAYHLLVDGNGDAAEQGRVSLHAIVHGALVPDNEFAAAAVRLAVIDRLKACGSDGSDPTAAALLRCAPSCLASSTSCECTTT